MIRSFKHKGLDLFYHLGSGSKLQPHHLSRIEEILSFLDVATAPKQLNQPGYHFHELSGDRKGTYSVKVNGNWRITFKFEDSEPYDVNYEDYH